MAKLALRLAFFAVGMNFVIPRLADGYQMYISSASVVYLCLPAVLLGSASFWAVRSFARSWPVILCIAVAWFGLCYGGVRTNHRGHLNVAYLTMLLPMAALIVEQRCWWLCARMYVLGCVAGLALALWFEYVVHFSGIAGAFYRFGNLLNAAGTFKLANPNLLGDQFALAAVLAFMLYLQGDTANRPNRSTAAATGRFGLGWMLFLSLGCVLTASRGAFLAWLGGISVLLLGGMRGQKSERLQGLAALCSVLIFAVVFSVAATGFRPWQTLQMRMESPAAVLSASGRVPIWIAALEVWLSNPRNFLLGLGTGLAPESLGAHMGYFLADGLSPFPTDCHNTFVEWGLSFGLVGMISGACLLWQTFDKARRLDRRDGTANRLAVLACISLASMAYVTVFQTFFLAAGPLILAMLSEPSGHAGRAEKHKGVSDDRNTRSPHFLGQDRRIAGEHSRPGLRAEPA